MGYDVGDVWMVKNVVNGKESELYLPGSFTNDEGEAQKRLYSLLILQRQA